MSLTSTLRPTTIPYTFDTGNQVAMENVPFHLTSDYLALTRMLTRYQNLILLTPAPDTTPITGLTPWQTKIQTELWSPLPFHRTKWLRNVEGARTLLLLLERSAQAIKVQRTKREAIKDLAEKRNLIKKLRSRIEEIGREVEAGGENVYATTSEDKKETLYDYLKQVEQQTETKEEQTPEPAKANEATPNKSDISDDREQLLNTNSNVRRRQGKDSEQADESRGKTSGFTNLSSLEKTLQASSQEHDDIAKSLVSMAAQLKQQARQFQFTLGQDKGLLDRALEGLDQNVSAMGIASKGINSLTRMSEEQGYFGRLKLYAIIFGMWIIAILLVFVGPKLRF